MIGPNCFDIGTVEHGSLSAFPHVCYFQAPSSPEIPGSKILFTMPTGGFRIGLHFHLPELEDMVLEIEDILKNKYYKYPNGGEEQHNK